MRRKRGKHEAKRGIRLPASAAAPAACALAAAVAIFALTEQAPEATTAESDFVAGMLSTLFAGMPQVYDPSSETLLGIGIRRWAHTVEFGVLGLFVGATAVRALPGAAHGCSESASGGAAAASLGICAACSLLDQCHKLFVPGRHFDAFDLAMDALGYGLAIAAVLAATCIRRTR